MPHYRRAHDYTLARHIIEQVALRVFGSGWMSRVHYRAGLHTPPRIWREQVALPGPRGAPPLRVVFASDFHAGPPTHPQVLAEACATIAALRPDLLLLGGDFVSWDQRFIAGLAPLLGAIPAPLGRYAVLGNHDLWADDPPIARALRGAGVEVLLNQEVRLPAPHGHLLLYGMDDPTAGRPLPPPDLPPGAARVVLMHAPEGLAQLAPSRYHLAIAGHTHGGQIALPGGAPIALLPGSLSRRFHAGRFTVAGGRQLLVSRGVGYGDLTVRWNAPTDILLLTLLPGGAL